MKVVFFTNSLLALVSIGAYTATAQPGGGLAPRLDSIAGAGVRENRAVGIAAAVVKGQDTLLLEAYGKADVEGNVPMTVDTVIPIGSTTKQFTAAAILQLRDQGKLSLDDDITKWLPDFDTRGNKVTLRHLLSHTSVSPISPRCRSFARCTDKGTPPPLAMTSTKSSIAIRSCSDGNDGNLRNTNSGSSARHREASGMTYEDYVEKKIFEPLGMTRSMYCNNSENVPRRTYGTS